MTLQEAIDFASVHANTDQFGIFVKAIISMHDEVQNVFEGVVEGKSSAFRPDLPPLNSGTAAIAGGGVTPQPRLLVAVGSPRGRHQDSRPAGCHHRAGLAGSESGAVERGCGCGHRGGYVPDRFLSAKGSGHPLAEILG